MDLYRHAQFGAGTLCAGGRGEKIVVLCFCSFLGQLFDRVDLIKRSQMSVRASVRPQKGFPISMKFGV